MLYLSVDSISNNSSKTTDKGNETTKHGYDLIFPTEINELLMEWTPNGREAIDMNVAWGMSFNRS